MNDRPILFSDPMVRALLDGRKTQTRRVLTPQPYDFPHPDDGHRCWNASGVVGGRICISDRALLDLHRKPQPGDRLWVRETLRANSNDQGARWYGYAVDGKDVWPLTEWIKARDNIVSIHMPRWASRLTLIVTDVRVQRLQEIDEADATAEGIAQCGRFFGIPDADWDEAALTARDAFANLWDSLNAKRGFGWAENPWVVAVTFTVHRRNVDQMQP